MSTIKVIKNDIDNNRDVFRQKKRLKITFYNTFSTSN